MGMKDFFGPAKSVTSTLVYDQKEFYLFLKHWLVDRAYLVEEKDYTEKIQANGLKLYAFNWQCEKRIDDFTKTKIFVYFQAEAENAIIETHDGKKKTVQNGTVTIKISSFLDIDPEEEWNISKTNATKIFFRELWIKLLAKGVWAEKQSLMNKDVKIFIDDINTYLKLYRYD